MGTTKLQIVLNTGKKSLLESSHPQKYLPNFLTQKNPRIENFKPKKSFDHPRLLKSGVRHLDPWGTEEVALIMLNYKEIF